MLMFVTPIHFVTLHCVWCTFSLIKLIKSFNGLVGVQISPINLPLVNTAAMEIKSQVFNYPIFKNSTKLIITL